MLKSSRNKCRISNNTDRKICVISGPSGVGKTTLCDSLLKKERRLAVCVTATTRPKRKGEVDGKDYRFLSERDFKAGLIRGDFIEYVRLFGHYYGTPYSSLYDVFRLGRHPLLRIEVKGARRLRKEGFKGVYIFILPPDMGTLKQRLSRRNDRTGDFEKRLRRARTELKYKNHYDFKVVNDDLGRTVNEIKEIIRKNLFKA
ncbi:MAG: guanylate kinase [Planctomycetota bacterium]